MAERGTDTSCNGQHCADTRHNCDLHLAPLSRSAFQCFAYRGGHSKHARIAAGDHRHIFSFGGGDQGSFRPLNLLSVVRRVAPLRRAFGDPIEVGAIAEQIIGSLHYCLGLWRQLLRVAWPESNNR